MFKRIVLHGVTLAALLVVVGVAYAFYTASATADDSTVTSGTVDLGLSETSGGSYSNTLSNAWDVANLEPGGPAVTNSLFMVNQGLTDTDYMTFDVTVTSDTSGASSVMSDQLRFTELTWAGESLLSGGAGADIDEYTLVNPLACDIQVNFGTNDYDRVSEAVNAASAGSVICVGPGNYTEAYENGGGGTGYPIAVDEANILLVASADPFSADKSTLGGAVNVTGSGATISGFEITDPDGGYGVSISGGASDVTVNYNYIHHIGSALASGSAQGISLQNGGTASSNFDFTDNTIMSVGNLSLDFPGSGGRSAKGIYLGDTGAAGVVDDVLIANNHIETIQCSTANWPTGRGAYGVLTNVDAGVTNLVVRNNTISDLEGLWSHAVGLEGLSTGALVESNDIFDLVNHKLNNDSVGVFIEDNTATGIVVQKNNLTPNVAYGVAQVTSGGGVIDATNNWWGDFDPSDQVGTVGPAIDTSDFAGGPFLGFVGGADGSNANGFADLADLAEIGFANVTPGLAAGGPEEEFTMGLQLDGPTTGNEYQAGSVAFDLVIGMVQQ